MALINFENNAMVADGLPVLRLGFRPFFFLAGITAVIWIILWLLILNNNAFETSYGAVNWHAHEMIFGYTTAVVAGFLLTAEKNWTGVQTPTSIGLGALVLIWFAGRIVPLINIPVVWSAVIDTGFLLILTVVLLIPLIKTSQYKHIVFVIITLVLFFADLLYHLGYIYPDLQTTQAGIRLGWLTIVLLITIMGGRVIPFFIERGTGETGKTRRNRVLEVTSFTLIIAWIVVQFISLHNYVEATLAIIAGCLQLIRVYGWHVSALWRNPMLWILYLGYAWIPVGLFISGYASFAGAGNSLAVHAFTAGAIGLLTIGMMARVALGHTGREIYANPVTSIAFVSVVIASLLRVLSAFTQFDVITNNYTLIVTVAGVLWASGFLLFLLVFVPILFKARIDGRPG